MTRLPLPRRPIGAPLAPAAQREGMTFAEFKEQAHRAFLLHVLSAHGWCVTRAARELRMARPNLYKLLRRHQIKRLLVKTRPRW